MEVRKLRCTVQHYAWGKVGTDSAVAQLYGACGHDVDAAKPYAELWMGTHPSGPAHLLGEAATLREYIGHELPFLFKVLSVNKALSIQAHPDKKLAEALHRTQPDVYKDDNHKPEMAVALTTFEALCGFRPIAEIVEFLELEPEFSELLGSASASFLDAVRKESNHEQALRELFSALMRSEQAHITSALTNLLKRIDSMADPSVTHSLIVRLAHQFPNDIGIFAVYVLNVITIEPGQGVYLSANSPHAYLSGDIVECMACSDNVVRAGLTPKLRDVDTLCDMLKYHCGPPQILTGKALDSSTTVYETPQDEFILYKTSVPSGTYTLPPVSQHAILLVTEGEAHIKALSMSVSKGSIVFVPKEAVLELDCVSLTLYRCCSRK